MNRKNTKKAVKRPKSLTDRMESNDILGATPLREVADNFDRNKIIKNLFPRTIESVCKRSKNGSLISTKTVVMDECAGRPPCNLPPNEGDPISLYNQMMNPMFINDKVLRYFSDNYAWLGWLTCATLAQHPFISRACSIPGEDAVAVGYKIEFPQSNGTDVTENENRIKRLIRETKRMGIHQVLRKFDYNKRVFGVGICIPCFEADTDEGKSYIRKMLSLPYNEDALKKQGIRYVGQKVVDPYWLTPVFDDDSGFDPASRDFYLPTWWQIGTTERRIHKSWCVQYVNTIVSDILKPTYYYGGMPLPQMLMQRVYSADKVADEAQMLAMSKRLLVVDANVQKLVANPKEAAKIMDALKFARDNWGVFFKNPNTNVQQVDTYITEFNQLIMTQYQLVASIAQIPAPKLLKVMPTGFSDVSELVWKDYAQHVCSIQEDELTPILDRHYTFHLLMNEKAKDYKDFEITFNPVDVPTLMEKAKISELETKSAKTLIEQGVLSPEEVRQVLRSKKGGEFSNVSKDHSDNAERKDDIRAEAMIEAAKLKAESEQEEDKDSEEYYEDKEKYMEKKNEYLRKRSKKSKKQ